MLNEIQLLWFGVRLRLLPLLPRHFCCTSLGSSNFQKPREGRCNIPPSPVWILHYSIKYLSAQSLLNGNKNQIMHNLKARECTNPNSKFMSQHRRVTFGYTETLKDVFRKLQGKGNFPKCCRSLPPRTGAELLKNIWFSRLFLCGFQGCFLVVSR